MLFYLSPNHLNTYFHICVHIGSNHLQTSYVQAPIGEGKIQDLLEATGYEIERASSEDDAKDPPTRKNDEL